MKRFGMRTLHRREMRVEAEAANQLLKLLNGGQGQLFEVFPGVVQAIVVLIEFDGRYD